MRVLWREHQHTAPTPFGPRAPRSGCEAPRSGHEPRPDGARRPARRGETAPWPPPRRVPGAPHGQSNRRGRGRIFKDGRGRLGRPLPSLNLFTPLSASVRRTVRGTSSGEVPSALPRGASRGRGGEVDRTESMKSCHRSNWASVFPALDAGAIHSQTLRSGDTCPRVPPDRTPGRCAAQCSQTAHRPGGVPGGRLAPAGRGFAARTGCWVFEGRRGPQQKTTKKPGSSTEHPRRLVEGDKKPGC